MSTYVFHQAALGDFVLTFPLLRQLPGPVHVVAPWSKAKLAERLFDHVTAHNIERPLEAIDGLADAETIISFVGDRGFSQAAPRAEVQFIDGPPPCDELPPLRCCANGPIVVHPGSGGRDKCWPMEHFRELIDQLPGDVPMICGEVEGKLPGARFCATLDELAGVLETARLFVGNDAGPTHLAAAMGVPTVALFGPTDPQRWAPIGPAVTVLAPVRPTAMTWLGVDTVRDGITSLLTL